jgi:DNA-binding PadR family transcriptional regulator
MDERELLLLGMLKAQSQHGYQINEVIEQNLGHMTDMKKPTAYALLERLAAAGYVEMRAEHEGNRPQRKVYSITPRGEQYFYALLRRQLAEATPLLVAGDIGLMFLDELPLEEATALLRERRRKLAERIVSYEQAPKHDLGMGVDLALEHALALMRADYAWLESTLARLDAMEPAQR